MLTQPNKYPDRSLSHNLLSDLLRDLGSISSSVRHSGRARETAHGLDDGVRRPGGRLPEGIRGFLRRSPQREGGVARPVVEGAARDDRDVVWEVQRGCYAEHGDDEEEDGVWFGGVSLWVEERRRDEREVKGRESRTEDEFLRRREHV